MPKAGSAKRRHAATADAVRRNAIASVKPPLVEIEEGERLYLIRPVPGRRKETFDLTALKQFSHLSTPIAEAVSRKLTELNTAASRKAFVRDLRFGLLQYLVENHARDIGPDSLTGEVVKNFIKWLNKKKGERTGKPLGKSIKQHYLRVVRQLIRILHPEQYKKALPANPFAHDETRKNVTDALDDDNFAKLGKVLKAAIPRLEKKAKIIDETAQLDAALLPLGIGYDSQKCSAWLVAQYGFIPERRHLQGTKIEAAINGLGIREVVACWGPSPAELMPIIYFIAALSAMNEQTLRDLKLSQIESGEVLGQPRTKVAPPKNRSRSRYRRSFEASTASDTVAGLFELVKALTKEIRKAAPLDCRDDLFLFVPRNRSKDNPVRSFSLSSSDHDFKNAQVRFLKESKLPFIGLQRIRATASEMVNKISNGDFLLLKALLGHRDLDTGRDHYRTRDEIRRGEERLADAMAQRERYLQSSGKVDPRTASKAAEQSAATPGFGCLDRYDSPIAGQKAGTPCSAYGRCPGCPLATPLADRSYGLARALQLRERMEWTRERLPSREWAKRWSTSHKRLCDYWIPLQLDETTLRAASALHLPPLPEIE